MARHVPNFVRNCAKYRAALHYNGFVQAWMRDGYVDDYSPAPTSIDYLGVIEIGQESISNGDRHAVFLTAIGQAGDIFGQPLVALVDRYFSVSSGATTTTTLSVHAPSGAAKSTSIPAANLNATFQPVTGEIECDTQRICWM